MSEQEFRDGMRLAVTDEPPMTFDLDELVITAERLMRRRRALIAVGTGTALVAVAAVAVPVLLGISGGGSAELPLAAPPTSTAPQTPAAIVPTKAQLAERGQQMQTYLRTVFPQVVAGATDVNPGLFGGEAEGSLADGQQYLTSFVHFTFNGVPTAVEVHVQSPTADQTGFERTCPTCTSTPQPDGSTVVTRQEDPGQGNNREMKIVSAVHFRKDGSVVRISTYNYDPTSPQQPVYQKAVALEVAQLTALATDTAFHL